MPANGDTVLVLDAIRTARTESREDIRELGRKVDKTAQTAAATQAHVEGLQDWAKNLDTRIGDVVESQGEHGERVAKVEQNQETCPARLKFAADATGAHQPINSTPPEVKRERVRQRGKIAVAIVTVVGGLLLAYVAGGHYSSRGGHKLIQPANVHLLAK